LGFRKQNLESRLSTATTHPKAAAIRLSRAPTGQGHWVTHNGHRIFISTGQHSPAPVATAGVPAAAPATLPPVAKPRGAGRKTPQPKPPQRPGGEKVYHGTPHDFEGLPRVGSYFTRTPRAAEVYQRKGDGAGRVVEAQINPKAKIKSIDRGWNDEDVQEFFKRTDRSDLNYDHFIDLVESDAFRDFLREKGYDAVGFREESAQAGDVTAVEHDSFTTLTKNALVGQTEERPQAQAAAPDAKDPAELKVILAQRHADFHPYIRAYYGHIARGEPEPDPKQFGIRNAYNAELIRKLFPSSFNPPAPVASGGTTRLSRAFINGRWESANAVELARQPSIPGQGSLFGSGHWVMVERHGEHHRVFIQDKPQGQQGRLFGQTPGTAFGGGSAPTPAHHAVAHAAVSAVKGAPGAAFQPRQAPAPATPTAPAPAPQPAAPSAPQIDHDKLHARTRELRAAGQSGGQAVVNAMREQGYEPKPVAARPEPKAWQRELAQPDKPKGESEPTVAERRDVHPSVKRALERQRNAKEAGAAAPQPAQEPPAAPDAPAAPPAASANPPTTKPAAKAAKAPTKAEIQRHLTERWEREGGDLGVQDDDALADFHSPFTFHRELPGEVKTFLEGRAHLKKLFTVTQDGNKAQGADAFGALGDEYFNIAERRGASRVNAALDHARNHHDPEVRLMAAIHDTLPPAGERQKVEPVKPENLELDTAGTINQIPVRVMLNEDGEKILQDHGDLPDTPVDALDRPVPFDKGSIHKEELPDVGALPDFTQGLEQDPPPPAPADEPAPALPQPVSRPSGDSPLGDAAEAEAAKWAKATEGLTQEQIDYYTGRLAAGNAQPDVDESFRARAESNAAARRAAARMGENLNPRPVRSPAPAPTQTEKRVAAARADIESRLGPDLGTGAMKKALRDIGTSTPQAAAPVSIPHAEIQRRTAEHLKKGMPYRQAWQKALADAHAEVTSRPPAAPASAPAPANATPGVTRDAAGNAAPTATDGFRPFHAWSKEGDSPDRRYEGVVYGRDADHAEHNAREQFGVHKAFDLHVGHKGGPVAKKAGQKARDVRLSRAADDVDAVMLSRHKFSSTQINLHGYIAQAVLAHAHAIPDSDLADGGRETEPHVTVKYGIHGSDVEAVRRALADADPVEIMLGRTSVFPATEDRQSDVLKVEVIGPGLHRLNKRLSAALPHTDTYPDYRPHVTLAYLRPGAGRRHTGRDVVEGMAFVADRVRFSDRDGHCTDIPLGKAAAVRMSRGDGQPYWFTGHDGKRHFVQPHTQGSLFGGPPSRPAPAHAAAPQAAAPTPKPAPAPTPVPQPAPEPATSAANLPPKGRVTDFGEKIGGARKDIARPTGPRAPKADDGDTRPAWAKRWVSMQSLKTGKWAVVRNDGGGQSNIILDSIYNRSTEFATQAEADAAIPLKEVARNHVVRDVGRRGEPANFAIVRKINDRKSATVKGGFATREEAMKYMAAHPVEIIEHKFPFPDEVEHLANVERTGKSRRTGDVSPEDFQTAFGFRGGEFGNWNVGREGQEALNHAYDALHDLADLLGVPPKAVSLNGELAIAFGARGTGGKGAGKAHYETDKRVINLTKIKGAGSLAHEWFHALDHYVGKLAGKLDTDKDPAFASHGLHTKHTARPELADAFKRVMDTITHKETEKAIESTFEAHKVGRYKENLADQIKRLESRFGDEARYNKKFKPFTPEQQKQWDAAKAKLLSGDVGEKKWVYPERTGGRLSHNARPSFEPIEEMNALYKQATGRGFASMTPGSDAHHLFWGVENIKTAETRLAEAHQGQKETKRITTDFYDEARKIDSYRGSDYYSERHEMAARAFGGYVRDRIEAAGNKSQYLSHGNRNNFLNSQLGKPYPEGAEREAIHAAFDHLFKTIRTEAAKDARGRDTVRMLSRSARGHWSALPGGARVFRLSRAWEEAKHPRAEDGRFGHTAGQHGGTVDTNRQFGLFAKDAAGNPAEVGERAGQGNLFAPGKPAAAPAAAPKPERVGSANASDPKHTAPLPFDKPAGGKDGDPWAGDPYREAARAVVDQINKRYAAVEAEVTAKVKGYAKAANDEFARRLEADKASPVGKALAGVVDRAAKELAAIPDAEYDAMTAEQADARALKAVDAAIDAAPAETRDALRAARAEIADDLYAIEPGAAADRTESLLRSAAAKAAIEAATKSLPEGFTELVDLDGHADTLAEGEKLSARDVADEWDGEVEQYLENEREILVSEASAPADAPASVREYVDAHNYRLQEAMEERPGKVDADRVFAEDDNGVRAIPAAAGRAFAAAANRYYDEELKARGVDGEGYPLGVDPESDEYEDKYDGDAPAEAARAAVLRATKEAPKEARGRLKDDRDDLIESLATYGELPADQFHSDDEPPAAKLSRSARGGTWSRDAGGRRVFSPAAA
jgi:hypothetical protein